MDYTDLIAAENNDRRPNFGYGWEADLCVSDVFIVSERLKMKWGMGIRQLNLLEINPPLEFNYNLPINISPLFKGPGGYFGSSGAIVQVD